MNPLVTIMIATYNQPDYIRQAVESCLNQDYENLEVVVGDDSTNNDNYEVLTPFLSNPKFKYFRNDTNLGRVKNYKKLLFERATGDWSVMLDGDDYYLDMSFISKAVWSINKDKDIVLVAAGHLIYDEQQQTKIAEQLVPEDIIFDGKEMFYKNIRMGQHSTDIYNRKLAIDLDFYRLDSMGTDSDGLYRLCLHGKVAYLSNIVVCWRIHNVNNTFNAEDAIKQMHEMVFIDKIYKYALDFIDKKTAVNWRRNFYKSMSYHVMTLAEKSGNPLYVFRVLKWAYKFWGRAETFNFVKRYVYSKLRRGK